MPPETRYAKSGDVSIAYQVVGEGEHDIVLVPGYISNVELAWEWESWARLFEGLAGLGRLILFDKRGTGLSDRATGIAQLETRMDDVRAVMDAAGSERAALIGVSEGVAMTLLFAATYPERTTAAVLYGSAPPRATWAPDFPDAPPREEWLRAFPSERRRSARVQKPSGLSRGSLRASRTTRSSSIGSLASSGRARAPRRSVSSLA